MGRNQTARRNETTRNPTARRAVQARTIAAARANKESTGIAASRNATTTTANGNDDGRTTKQLRGQRTAIVAGPIPDSANAPARERDDFGANGGGAGKARRQRGFAAGLGLAPRGNDAQNRDDEARQREEAGRTARAIRQHAAADEAHRRIESGGRRRDVSTGEAARDAQVELLEGGSAEDR